MTYKPEPLDTGKIELDQSLLQLVEMLARNTHDVWSQQRIADGWRYGPYRDDQKKEHPGLIPYEQLDESEKEYDRRTAIEVLKAILAMGYRIER